MIAIGMAVYTAAQFHREGTGKAFCYGVSFFALACYLDRICYLVIEGIIGGNGQGQSRGAGLYLVGMLMSKGLMAALLFCFKNREAGSREETLPEKKRKMTYMERLTAGVSLFSLALLAGVHRLAAGNFLMAEFLFLLLCVTALCIYDITAYFHVRTELRLQEERQKEAERKKADAYLYTIESNYQRTRELWHDLKNHIGLLDMLLQEQKYDEMKDYLRIFNQDVDEITLPAKSGNLIVDAVLADKVSQARKEDVPVSLELCDFSGLSLKPDEICSLLGNLLDNAIEACRRVEQGKRITVECRAQENCYYISVRNSANGKFQERDRHFLTTKEDMRNGVGHGLGLRSVERVVNRYAGELLAEGRTGEFVVVVRLPR